MIARLKRIIYAPVMAWLYIWNPPRPADRAAVMLADIDNQVFDAELKVQSERTQLAYLQERRALLRKHIDSTQQPQFPEITAP